MVTVPPKTSLPVIPVRTGGTPAKLVIIALVAAVVYSMFSQASFAICPGGFDGSGGFLDSNGEPTSVAPQCLAAHLQPNGWMYVLIATIAAAGIFSSGRSGTRRTPPNRVVTVAALTIVVVVSAALVVSYLTFFSFDPGAWQPGEPVTFPWPLTVDVTITPMRQNPSG